MSRAFFTAHDRAKDGDGLMYSIWACRNLEAELAAAGSPDAAHFRQRQIEVQREINRRRKVKS